MDVSLLRAKMQERHMSVADMADKIGIDESTFYRKLNDKGEKFTVAQVRGMALAMALTPEEAMDLFFK